jgi:hypothetical protein
VHPNAIVPLSYFNMLCEYRLGIPPDTSMSGICIIHLVVSIKCSPALG